MKPPSSHWFLIAVATLSLGFARSAAAAPAMPQGLRLEVFTGATHEDNYRQAGANKEDDTYFNTGMALAYLREGGFGDISIRGSVEHEKHTEFHDSDGILYSFHPEVAIHESSWTLSLAADVSRQNGMSDGAVRTESYTGIGFSARGTMAVTGSLSLAASVEHTTHAFDDNEFEDLGYDSTRLSFTPYYVASQKLTLGIRTAYTASNYEDDTRPDTRNTTLGAVASYRLTGKVKTQFGAGVERIEFSSSAAADSKREQDWYMDLSAIYEMSSKFSATVGLSRGIETSYRITSELVEFPNQRDAPAEAYAPRAWYLDSFAERAWRLDASLRYEVSSRFSATLVASRSTEASYVRQAVDGRYDVDDDHRTTDRTALSLRYAATNALQLGTSLGCAMFDEENTGDKATEISWSLDAVYRLGERMAVTGGYGFTSYRSDTEGEDYRNNRFQLGMRAFF